MKNKDDKHLNELLVKLQNLAERGVGGEKETAKKKLAKLLKENGLTENDLNEQTEHYYLFKYKDALNKRLLMQCIFKTMGAANDISIYRTKGKRNKLGIYCTPAQKLEIDLDFEFYSALFEQEADIFMSAFIDKQDIYPKDAPVLSINSEELNSEDIEKLKKRSYYRSGVSKRVRAAGMIESSSK